MTTTFDALKATRASRRGCSCRRTPEPTPRPAGTQIHGDDLQSRIGGRTAYGAARRLRTAARLSTSMASSPIAIA